MSIAGCIIPTPLEQESNNTVNSPPKILDDQVMPTYMVPFTRAPNQDFTFYVAASNAKIDAVLHARLLFSTANNTMPAQDVEDITLTAATTSDVTVFSGTFGAPSGRAYCALLPTGSVEVYVAVTNATFSDDDDDKTPNKDTDRDEIAWTMTCTN